MAISNTFIQRLIEAHLREADRRMEEALQVMIVSLNDPTSAEIRAQALEAQTHIRETLRLLLAKDGTGGTGV